MGHWSSGAQDRRAKRQKDSSGPRGEGEAKRPTMLQGKAINKWAKKGGTEIMPQPAGGIWSSQGRSFATPIKDSLLPAWPCCGFPRQKWLCYWASTGAWTQL